MICRKIEIGSLLKLNIDLNIKGKSLTMNVKCSAVKHKGLWCRENVFSPF